VVWGKLNLRAQVAARVTVFCMGSTCQVSAREMIRAACHWQPRCTSPSLTAQRPIRRWSAVTICRFLASGTLCAREEATACSQRFGSGRPNANQRWPGVQHSKPPDERPDAKGLKAARTAEGNSMHVLNIVTSPRNDQSVSRPRLSALVGRRLRTNGSQPCN